MFLLVFVGTLCIVFIGIFGTCYVVLLLVFVGHNIECFGWYLWESLCNVSIDIFETHCVVFLLVFVGHTI